MIACIKRFEITNTFHFSLDSRTKNVDQILVRILNATFNSRYIEIDVKKFSFIKCFKYSGI